MKTVIRLLKYIILSLLLLILCISAIFYRPDISYEAAIGQFSEDESKFFESQVLGFDDNNHQIIIHYLDYGNPEDIPIVLLHGAFSSSLTFKSWKNTLVNQGYRVVLIDLPYHGLSTGFSDQVTSIRRSAEVVVKLLNYLQIKSFFIGGNSMGGGVSWYLTGAYHGSNDIEVLGLILIDSTYPMESSGAPDSWIINVVSSDIIAPIITKITPRFLFERLLDGVYGSSSIPSTETIDRYYNMLRVEGHRLAILQNTFEALSVDDQLEILKNVAVYDIPILLQWGEEDSWIPVSTTERFKQTLNLSDDQIIIYSELGHVPMEEDPSRTIIDIIEFLEFHS